LEQVLVNELSNHETASLSDLDLKMVRCVPPGGNWKNIDPAIPSKRLEQIREKRKGGSRSTYYGRLRIDRPAFTISTNFNRPGNGCFIHPTQNRLISMREAARIQSFPDSYRFFGSKGSIYKQIGNAVPPLLAYALGKRFRPTTFLDLFCGAGGLSLGMEMAGHACLVGVDSERTFLETFSRNRTVGRTLLADMTNERVLDEIAALLPSEGVGLVVGGPPCQGFSEAGNKRRVDDPRNQLYKHYLAALRKFNPNCFLMEQIPSVQSLAGGEFFLSVLDDFRELEGYRVAWQILRADEFSVPQVRRRLFIVGIKGEQEFSFPRPLFGPLLNTPITVGEAISDLPPLQPGGGVPITTRNLPANLSRYQEWATGRIGFDQFISSLELGQTENK
jgi:DNA (cytosine-5)-methyltransferase 1